MRQIKKGSTSQSVVIRIVDSADGTPETGVVFNTSGIDLWYRRETAAKVSVTEATLAALTTAWTDGGFLHIGDGYYRLDVADAAFAAGAGINGVMIGGTVTGMVVIGAYVPLVDFDPYDTVRMGLTALPNAVVGAAGGLTAATGAGDVPGVFTSAQKDAIAASLLDLANSIETGLTLRQAQRLAMAALAGKLSGGGTATEIMRNAVADAKARLTATVDSSGNRTAITYDLT